MGQASADAHRTTRPGLTLSDAGPAITLCHSAYPNSETWQLVALARLNGEHRSTGIPQNEIFIAYVPNEPTVAGALTICRVPDYPKFALTLRFIPPPRCRPSDGLMGARCKA